MTDIWSTGITVRICDCRSQDEGSTPSWTAKYILNGPVVELVTMPRCQRVWLSVRVRPGPQVKFGPLV